MVPFRTGGGVRWHSEWDAMIADLMPGLGAVLAISGHLEEVVPVVNGLASWKCIGRAGNLECVRLVWKHMVSDPLDVRWNQSSVVTGDDIDVKLNEVQVHRFFTQCVAGTR
jgi:hypothetical protein